MINLKSLPVVESMPSMNLFWDCGNFFDRPWWPVRFKLAYTLSLSHWCMLDCVSIGGWIFRVKYHFTIFHVRFSGFGCTFYEFSWRKTSTKVNPCFVGFVLTVFGEKELPHRRPIPECDRSRPSQAISCRACQGPPGRISADLQVRQMLHSVTANDDDEATSRWKLSRHKSAQFLL